MPKPYQLFIFDIYLMLVTLSILVLLAAFLQRSVYITDSVLDVRFFISQTSELSVVIFFTIILHILCLFSFEMFLSQKMPFNIAITFLPCTLSLWISLSGSSHCLICIPFSFSHILLLATNAHTYILLC